MFSAIALLTREDVRCGLKSSRCNGDIWVLSGWGGWLVVPVVSWSFAASGWLVFGLGGCGGGVFGSVFDSSVIRCEVLGVFNRASSSQPSGVTVGFLFFVVVGVGHGGSCDLVTGLVCSVCL